MKVNLKGKALVSVLKGTSSEMILQALVFLNIILYASSDRVVHTSTGDVRGVTLTIAGTVVDAFLGIPYAEPPIGDLRFGIPVPKQKWTGVYNATTMPPPCMQNITTSSDLISNIEDMTEDCLYLNVWIPRQSSDELKPIILFIHGGAYSKGASTGSLFNCAALAARGDVVVVSLNFRVGVFGFLSTSTEEAEGNMGIKDILLAVEWIVDNAKVLGGNSNTLSIMGESSGAITSSGAVIIKNLNGAYKRLILHSGSVFSPLMHLCSDQKALEVSTRISKRVGCSNDTVNISNNPQVVVDCLKHTNPTELTAAEGVLMDTSTLSFLPRLDDVVIPKNLIQRFRNGQFYKSDVIIGITDNEGAMFVTVALVKYFNDMYGSNYVKMSKGLAHTFISYVSQFFGQNSTKEIANFYIQNSNSSDYTQAAVDFMGDIMVNCGVMFLADFLSLYNSSVYFYKMVHRSSISPHAPWMGVTHTDDLQFIFGFPLTTPEKYTKQEVKLSKRIMDRWTAFAKNGNPNIPLEVNWPKYTYSNPEYLEIGLEDTVRRKPMERCEFWRDRYNAKIDDELLEQLSSPL